VNDLAKKKQMLTICEIILTKFNIYNQGDRMWGMVDGRNETGDGIMMKNPPPG